MLSVFSYIIKVSCPSVNENEAPARITSSYGGFVVCDACISSILPMDSIAQHISNFNTRTSRNIPADTDRARADLTDVDGQSIECAHALLVDDLCVSS